MITAAATVLAAVCALNALLALALAKAAAQDPARGIEASGHRHLSVAGGRPTGRNER
jgi:hypothetical protein